MGVVICLVCIILWIIAVGVLVTQCYNVARGDLYSMGHIWETVPFVVSVNGALGHETLLLLHCLAEKLSVGCRDEKLTAQV